MSPQADQRTDQRRPAHIIAEYRVKEGIFRDIIKNIGTGGIFIKTQRKIEIGQKIEMRFPLFTFQHNIQITGTVIRNAPGGFAVLFDQPVAGIINKDGTMTDIVHEIDRPAEP